MDIRQSRDAKITPVDTFPACSCEVMQVIHSQIVRGEGTEEDMVRYVDQYWSLEGELLAEYDPIVTQSYVRPAHRRLNIRWPDITPHQNDE